MPYNFDQMLKDGYSVADINQALSQKEGLNYVKMKQDGHSDDDIFNALKGKYTQPKTDKEATDEFLGALKGAGESVGGAVDVAANIAANVIGTPVAGLASAIAVPFVGADKAEDFRKDFMENTFYAKPMTDKGEKYNQWISDKFEKAQNFMAENAAPMINSIPVVGSALSEEDKRLFADVGAGAFMNLAPIHGVAKVPGMLLNKAEQAVSARRAAKAAKPIEAPKSEAASRVAAMKQKQAPTQAPQDLGLKQAIYNQADAEQVARLEAYFNKQNEPQPTISVDSAGQAMSPEQLQQLRQQQAQSLLEARQKDLERQVARQTSLDMNAAERARQEQAPVPGLEQARQAELARQAAETEQSIARTQDLNTRGQQMTIQEDFGNNNPMDRMPNMRVDENGIPIRADLSMEAQNLQNPLQRNLWGDELPVQTGDGGIPLTQALDSMPPGPARESAIAQLSNGLSGKQRGALAFEVFLPKSFKDFVEKWHKAGGNFSYVSLSRMLEDHPVKLDESQRGVLASLYPETAKKYQEKIDRAWAQNNQDRAMRWGKNYDDALIAEAVIQHYEAFGKGFKLGGPHYAGKKSESRARSADQAETLLLNMKHGTFSGMGKGQRGALDPEVFKQGYRGVNRILSKLTEMPWVRERFPEDKYLTNKDGTPMILLHGTQNGFADRVRVKGEGIHAGYGAEAAHMFTRNKYSEGRTKAFPGRLEANPTAAIYPMVVKKGIYPYIPKDIGAWAADDILNSHTNLPNATVVEAIAKETGRSAHSIEGMMDDLYHSLKNRGLTRDEWNAEFSDFLARNFDIRGFFYKNSYESTKNILRTHAGEFPSPKRARALSEKLDDNKSFVTWDENNLTSLYGENPMQLGKQEPATWASGLGNSQMGALNLKDITDGIASLFGKSGTLPTKSTPVPIPKEDSLKTPITPETIARKQELADKAAAIGMKNSSYSRVTTREEALSDLEGQKDMSKFSPNSLRSGIEAVVRTNTTNKVLNYARNLVQEGINTFETNSKQYVTSKETGMVSAIKKLTPKERVELAEVLHMAQLEKVDITPENIKQLELSPAQEAALLSIKRGLDARLGTAHAAMLDMGMQPFEPRAGYIPASFSGAYTSFIGKYVKDPEAPGGKRFVTTGIAQADTAYGLKKAVEKYKTMGDNYSVEIPTKRRGLNTRTSKDNNAYNGFNDLVKQLADSDPEFARAKAIVDQHIVDEVHALYRFDVHEINKSGVKGSIGDRPWKTKLDNANELFESIVNYTEDGFHYDAMQKPLAEIKALQAMPELQSKMPNALNYLQQFDAHLSGKDLNVAGAFMNALVDAPFKMVGLGPSIPRNIMRQWSAISYGLMTNLTNLGFTAMQLSQLALSGPLEMMRIRAEYNLNPMDLAQSLPTATMHTIGLAFKKGYEAPQHLAEAFKWAHEKGIFDYSEAELAHELRKSSARVIANKVINASTIYSEKATRGPLFMTFADLFHKAGFRGEEALLRAQEASNYSMTNYIGEQRPMIYQSLGEVGRLMGALATFKHNFAEQMAGSVINAKKYPAATAAMLGLIYTVYGVSGLPGYQDADQLVKKVTGKSMREFALTNPEQGNSLWDGMLSAKTNVDIQTRVTNSSLLPDSAVQSMPHVGNFARIIEASYNYAMEQDVASLRKLQQAAMPAGIRNVWEDQTLVDEMGVVRNAQGQVAAERPRTPEERTLRKLFGVKPLDERINQELEYSRKQGFKMSEQKIKDLQTLLNNQVINGESVTDTINKLTALGVDPQQALQSAVKAQQEAAKTPKTRDQGTPTNLSGVRRYNAFNP